jgi:hypothetical protein
VHGAWRSITAVYEKRMIINLTLALSDRTIKTMLGVVFGVIRAVTLRVRLQGG